MSEISQKMGFDASQAIATLENLDKVMQAMNASVSAAPAAFAAFNTKAGKTVAALKHLHSNAKAAASELQRVASLQGKVGASVAPKQTPGTMPGGAPVTPDLSPYIAQLQKLYQISGSASKEQKRAFQAAITSAADYAAKHKKTATDIASTNAKMAQNMTGTANKMANAMANISKKAKVLPPDTSAYIKRVQSLIPLTKSATEAQKRAWQSLSSKIAIEARRAGMSVREMAAINSKLGQSLTGSANKIANDMQKMQGSAKQTAKVWTVSWETMARVVATQAIVRTLSTIRQAFRAAIGDAIKFQKAVAEIGTISEEGLGGLDDIGNMLKRVSDQFNVGLGDTAEAAYQTVSNQIANSEEDVEAFLATAAKFAKITKTDMSTAVNLLSGTLNAFGKEVGEAESVAAKFFSTIKLGRTRAEELAQSIGTIQPIAKQLGVSMEELNAGVATLTIQGLKTDKVVTQLRGVMQSFLKPTKEMKAAMAELGFETGEQVLEAYNLQEAMEALKGTTDGSAQSFAKLIPRVRGMTGGIGLAEDASGDFTKSLDEQKKALDGLYSEAYTLIVETDAEKVTKFFNEIKNFFTTTVGQFLLRETAVLIDFYFTADVSEAQKFLDAEKKILASKTRTHDRILEMNLSIIESQRKTAAQVAAVQRQQFNEQASIIEQANARMSASASWAIDSLIAPVKAASAEIQKLVAEMDKTLADSAQHRADSLSGTQETLFQRSVTTAEDPELKISLLKRKSAELALAAQEKAANAKSASDLKEASNLQTLSKAYNNQAWSIANSNKVKGEAGKLSNLFAIHDARYRNSVIEGEKAIESSRKSLGESAKDVIAYTTDVDRLSGELKELQKAASDPELSPQMRTDALENVRDKAKELLETLQGGINKFADSANPAVKALFEMIKMSDKDVEIATVLKIPENIATIQQQIVDAIGEIEIPFKLIDYASLKGLTLDTPKQIDAVRVQRGEDLEENAVTMIEYRKQVDAVNSAKKTAVQLATQELKLLKELPKEEQDAIDTPNERQFSDFVDNHIKDLRRLASGEREVTKVALKRVHNTASLLEGLGALTKEGHDTIQTLINSLEVMRAGPKEAPDNLGLQLQEEQWKRLQKAEWEVIDGQDVLNASTANGKAGVDALAQSYGELNVKLTKNTELSQQASQAPLDTLEAQTADPQVAKQAEVAAFNTAEQGKRAQLEQTRVKMESLQSEAAANPVVPQIDTQPFIMEINGVKFELQDLPAKVDESTRAAGVLQNQVSSVGGAAVGVTALVGGITTALEGSISAAQRLIATLSQVQSVQGPVTASQGGQIGYFASGGRGTDTIPAMLSEGEFVTNAKSSRRFFSQLQAINAGRTPVYRESGGSTTNIGDVSISVNESSSPRQTGREVMQAFRRETRRGSGRI